jgi:hypothetical protein
MSLEQWQNVCKELNLQYVKKGSKEYEIVKKVYDLKYPKKESEGIPSKWTLACRQANVKIARKGSPEYDSVMTIFKTLN